MIGDDEARHAELAWSVLTWTLEAGGESVRSAVALRVAKLDEELAPRAPDFTGRNITRLVEHGLSDQGALEAIAIRRIAWMASTTFSPRRQLHLPNLHG
ncbi:MAG: hypothetical protein HS111_10330 [Kofleriaceae bacterium]|nr:hypothetical protein [Kofleriaceae bacterium]